MEEIRSTLLEILEGLHPDEDFENCTELVDGKVLDSFDIVTLISDINDEFDVVISADKIVPENFNSLDALCELISSLMDED
ncbi:MAG: acyl carrier protein [Lachnospiraceae bacterium]|nr:acyl carrier protein [Lachnospiraceae bacterium]